MIFDSIYHEITGKRILAGIYLKVEPGKICGLFGPNGSGKTTLLKIGAGVVLPTTGRVFIDGQAFSERKVFKRYGKIAYLSQETFLPRDTTVVKLLRMISSKTKDIFSVHFPSKLINRKIGALSGGELRLLELIFVVSLNRLFLLLDEPFTGIEPLYIEKMMRLISEQSRLGKGILITDHYYRYTAQLSDYGYFMKNGECHKLDEQKTLAEQLREKGYLGSQSVNQHDMRP